MGLEAASLYSHMFRPGNTEGQGVKREQLLISQVGYNCPNKQNYPFRAGRTDETLSVSFLCRPSIKSYDKD